MILKIQRTVNPFPNIQIGLIWEDSKTSIFYKDKAYFLNRPIKWKLYALQNLAYILARIYGITNTWYAIVPLILIVPLNLIISPSKQ